MKNSLNLSNHITAVLAAFFVTLLWSSSWVLIKIGLNDISPLVFAGLRYVFAAIILSTRILITPTYRNEVRTLNRRWWVKLIFYGIFYYSITQGAQFVGLYYLPAITVTFMLNLTTIFVLILGIFLLHEYPTHHQVWLILLSIIGIFLFFYPIELPTAQIFGLIIVSIGVVANAFSSIIGRSLNQLKEVSPYVITTISMIVGSSLLLIAAIMVEGVPKLSLGIIILILWLAVVNTAVAFVIWNFTLQELRAVESSIINSTMLPQITILAMIFFDERLIFKEWVGLTLIFITGVTISLVRKNVVFTNEDTD